MGVKAMQNERDRWKFAGLHYQSLRLKHAWGFMLAGVAAAKASRIKKAVQLRSAVEFLVNSELTTLRHVMTVWQAWTADKIVTRRRHNRILKWALHHMMNKALYSSFEAWYEWAQTRKKFVAFVIRMQSIWRRRGPMKYLKWMMELQAAQVSVLWERYGLCWTPHSC